MAVTKAEISRRLGISRSAVSLILNSHPSARLSPETRAKVLSMARELGYEEPARRKHKDAVLFLLIQAPVGGKALPPWRMHELSGVENLAHRWNMQLIFCHVATVTELLTKINEGLVTTNMRGAIIAGQASRDCMPQLDRLGIPYVIASTVDLAEANVLAADIQKIGRDAVHYLASLGHRDIALFTGSLVASPANKLAWIGYQQGLEEWGLPQRRDLVQVASDMDGQELVQRSLLMELGASAIVCVNEQIAVGTVRTLKEHGIRVPAEVSVIGIGHDGLAELHGINLTSYDTISPEWFAQLEKLFWEHVRNPRTRPQRRVVAADFVNGTTTGPPPADPRAAWTRDRSEAELAAKG